jgi:hypothetical protein
MLIGEMFCDLAKAFDNVNHKILLAKNIYVEFKEYGQFGPDHI